MLEGSHGHVSGQQTEARKRFNKFRCVKHGIYATSTILFIGCLATVAGCVYMFVDWSFLDDIMDYDIPSASMWILILSASVTLIFIPITGCAGARNENKCLLLTNIGLLCGVFMALVLGAVFALVWQGEIGAYVSVKMEMSLKELYGVNLDNKYNQLITQQWDLAQEKMMCCGIRSEGWSIYRQTRWFNEQPYIQDSSFADFRYGSRRPMVPRSCCAMDNKKRVYNLNKCQRFHQGPPYRYLALQGEPLAFNNAIHYKGCYAAARSWIRIMSSTLLGIGITVSIIMMVGVFLSLALLLLIRE